MRDKCVLLCSKYTVSFEITKLYSLLLFEQLVTKIILIVTKYNLNFNAFNLLEDSYFIITLSLQFDFLDIIYHVVERSTVIHSFEADRFHVLI